MRPSVDEELSLPSNLRFPVSFETRRTDAQSAGEISSGPIARRVPRTSSMFSPVAFLNAIAVIAGDRLMPALHTTSVGRPCLIKLSTTPMAREIASGEFPPPSVRGTRRTTRSRSSRTGSSSNARSTTATMPALRGTDGSRRSPRSPIQRDVLGTFLMSEHRSACNPVSREQGSSAGREPKNLRCTIAKINPTSSCSTTGSPRWLGIRRAIIQR